MDVIILVLHAVVVGIVFDDGGIHLGVACSLQLLNHCFSHFFLFPFAFFFLCSKNLLSGLFDMLLHLFMLLQTALVHTVVVSVYVSVV